MFVPRARVLTEIAYCRDFLRAGWSGASAPHGKWLKPHFPPNVCHARPSIPGQSASLTCSPKHPGCVHGSSSQYAIQAGKTTSKRVFSLALNISHSLCILMQCPNQFSGMKSDHGMDGACSLAKHFSQRANAIKLKSRHDTQPKDGGALHARRKARH
jgi:hypothetical protein